MYSHIRSAAPTGQPPPVPESLVTGALHCDEQCADMQDARDISALVQLPVIFVSQPETHEMSLH